MPRVGSRDRHTKWGSKFIHFKMLTLQNVKFEMSEYTKKTYYSQYKYLPNFGFLNLKKLASFRGAYFSP